ncbi:hypothetical protein LWC33_25085 [Pseudonocardia sp. RS11V-5]|uniref:hypothetical protein n=1 Tax=Pseudonocardia terrae TaxID=2905831 RepID=UPI001E414A3F|nr:hypothetical protein [Pseudonocardia terrae]MCE3554719.1 hypothetical protein [Pseudonocardia terrae]
MRKIFLAASGAAVAVVGLVGFAAPATAAEAGHPAYIKAPTTAYQNSNNQSGAVFTNLKPNQQVTALCFTEGQEIDGNHNWFRISLTPDPQGKTGFVHRDAISVDASPDEMKHC